MDRHRIQLQIRSVLVTYRAEKRHRDTGLLRIFRDRAREILAPLDERVGADADLRGELADARRELGLVPSAGDGPGE